MRGCTFNLSPPPFGSKSLWASGEASASKSSVAVFVGVSERTSCSSRGSFVLSLIVVNLGVMRSEYLDSQRYKIIGRCSTFPPIFRPPETPTHKELITMRSSRAHTSRAHPLFFENCLHIFTQGTQQHHYQTLKCEGKPLISFTLFALKNRPSFTVKD